MATLYEYYNTGDGSQELVYGENWTGQTFTPSIAHKITSVKLKLWRYASPGTITVSIRETDGEGHPTSGDLCSGTTDGNTLPTGSPYEWREITLGVGYDLDADTKYAIVIRAPGGSPANVAYWRCDIGDATYLGGNREVSSNSGSSWTAHSFDDHMFEDWSEVAPTEQAVGDGSVGMAGTLSWKFVQAVGDGAVGMTGSLGLKIKLAVGDGLVAMAGLLETLFVIHLPVVKIDGVQVTILRNSLMIDMRIEERSIAEFTVIDKTAASHYVKGQPVQIWDNGNHLTFGGVIDTPEEERKGSGLHHHISCADYHYLADKRIVAETYENELAGDIVKHVRINYLDAEGITIGTIQDGPTLKQVIANYVRASEFFDALAEKANFIWEINELKELNFIDRATNAAPWTATNLEIIRGSARLSHGNPLYRNRQFIRGGKAETSEQVENRTGDGEKDSFAMGYPLAKVPAITVVGRGAQTVGIKGIDTGKDWYWSKGDPVVTAAVPPEDTKAIQVTYIGEFNIITLSEDDDAIIDRQTVEGGGTGYVDDIFRDPNLSSIEAYFETAAKKLQRYGVMGRKLIYRTHKRGLVPGQLQPVNYPPFNLSNTELLIEAVKVRGEGKLFTYEITAVEGPEVGGWSKFFQRLVEREKTIDRLTVGEEETIIILVQESEEWGWQEAVDVSVFACPVPSVDLYPETTLYPC